MKLWDQIKHVLHEGSVLEHKPCPDPAKADMDLDYSVNDCLIICTALKHNVQSGGIEVHTDDSFAPAAYTLSARQTPAVLTVSTAIASMMAH